MTPELTVLALAAILQALQIGLAAVVMNSDVGAQWNAGPRDHQPDFSPMTGRLRRAVNNHFESLAFFTVAALVTSVSGQGTALTAWASWIYLGARILYVPAYALGWTPWRSVIWGVGFVATMIIIVAALF
ncbi:MAPEG family protein [Paracoccus xiamenensis]|uniref:MAPEG family protein n=1 Tax=Paracoccus xiamenensis TaxID=2714901 RepID=UPI001409BCCA|nr:MAPEG family protein [Paracoccus xiamenensis]NHF71849.1 MAPEG family protein [Paracoccus xiamenensis]